MERDRHAAALERLVREGVLTAAQAEAVALALDEPAVPGGAPPGGAAPGAAPGRPVGGWWIEALGYVGGILMLAGTGTLLSLSWADLSRAGRLLSLAVVAVVLVAAAVGIAGGPARISGLASPVRRRIVGTLFAITSGVVGGAAGAGVLSRSELAVSVAGLVTAVAGYALVHTAVGALTAGGWSVAIVFTAFDALISPRQPLVVASALLAVGALWTVLTAVDIVVPRQVGFGVGAAVALLGGQEPLFDGTDLEALAYTLTFAVAVAAFILYRSERATILLLAGVAGMSIAVPEAVWDITDGAGGAAAILLVSGAVLLAASAVGVRMYRS
jgi:hypothetical protein